MKKIYDLTKSQYLTISKLTKNIGVKKYNRILVEGEKCCSELLYSNYKIDYFVVDANYLEKYNTITEQATQKNIPIYQTKTNIFEKISDAKTPQGILAIAFPKVNNIFDKNKSFILMDNISDPGNVGTIIRTAEWFGIYQIILYGNGVYMYSPKIIRSTMGSIFRANMFQIKDANLLKNYLADISLYAASLDSKVEINDIKPSNIFGLLVGNETRGISDDLKEYITESFYIKGYSQAESLNVAIATGISLFHFKNKF